MRISEIRIGENWAQRDPRDVALLAERIRREGLLRPLHVTRDGELVAGLRRLRAVESLGWEEVEVRVIDVDDPRLLKADENGCQCGLPLSDKVALWEFREPRERAAAKERQREGGRTKGKGHVTDTEAPKGSVRARLEQLTGLACRTYRKAREIVDAAREDPKRFEGLVEEMDRTGETASAYRKLREWRGDPSPEAAPRRRRRSNEEGAGQSKRALEGVAPLNLPTGSFDAIVVGPDCLDWASSLPPGATIEDVAARLPVPQVLAGAGIVYLWAETESVDLALALVRAWDFEFKTVLTWVRRDLDRTRNPVATCVMCVVATRRGTEFPAGTIGALIEGAAAPDGGLPAEFRMRAEAASGERRLHLFTSAARPGWESLSLEGDALSPACPWVDPDLDPIYA